MGAFQMGALEFYKAVLVDHPTSVVETADRVIPAHLTEPELSRIPPPPKFLLTPEDFDRNVEEGTLEDPLEAEEESEGEREEAGEGIPPGELSIPDTLADDSSDPLEE